MSRIRDLLLTYVSSTAYIGIVLTVILVVEIISVITLGRVTW